MVKAEVLSNSRNKIHHTWARNLAQHYIDLNRAVQDHHIFDLDEKIKFIGKE